MILGYENYSMPTLISVILQRDKEYISNTEEIEELKETIKKLKNELLIESKRAELNFKELKKLNLIGKNFCSSDIFETVFDYESDEGYPYYCIPIKEIANELLIDSGYAVTDGFRVKVHLEIL